MRAKLGVNVDHVATIRQSRTNVIYPDPVTATALAELAGADGITIHLREDRRHIQDRDLNIIKQTLQTRLNLEMAAVDEMMKIAIATKPDSVCLVPEKREEQTTEGGLNLHHDKDSLIRIINSLKENNIIVSLFINPEPKDVELSKEFGADFVEIHTGCYSDAANQNLKDVELLRINNSVKAGVEAGIGVNAGHGLNYENILPVAKNTDIYEFNIGHSIIARAVLVGMERAVKDMLNLLQLARS